MNLSNGIKVVYRVSDTLRQERTDSVSRVRLLHVLEQCGNFYYFESIESAILAMKEFATSIDVVRAYVTNKFSDDLFPVDEVVKLSLKPINFEEEM